MILIMAISKKVSNICLEFIKNNTSNSPEDLEKIYYGIQVIWINLFKLILLLVTAYFLGILKYTLIGFIFFAIIRTYGSGLHANSTIQCIIINYILFLGNPYLSLTIPLNAIARFIIFFISFILLIIYAPADTKERPLISKKLRENLKTKSIIVSIIFYIITLLNKNEIYNNLIIFSTLQESLVITPIAYRLLGKTYANYKNISV